MKNFTSQKEAIEDELSEEIRPHFLTTNKIVTFLILIDSRFRLISFS